MALQFRSQVGVHGPPSRWPNHHCGLGWQGGGAVGNAAEDVETLVLDGHQDASKFFNDIHKGVKIDSYLRPEVVAQLVDGFY